jgi:hypothetical protein
MDERHPSRDPKPHDTTHSGTYERNSPNHVETEPDWTDLTLNP